MEIFANTTTPFSPTNTTHIPSDTVPSFVGYIALSISVFFLGSNYLPVKAFETGDGMFFQLILTSGIWFVGFVVNCIQGFPKMYPLAMLGGVFWSTGNLFVVPIIKSIGIGMGTLFWNTVLLVLGWAVARFGAFNIKPEIPNNPTLNYVGVSLAAISGIFYLFVRNETSDTTNQDQENLIQNNNPNDFTSLNEIINVSNPDSQQQSGNFLERLNPNMKRILGTTMAVVAGILYAFTFTPALFIQDNYENASQNALDYVFSLYTGIYVVSITYFTIYCVIKKNKPEMYPRVILPGLASGLMWGIGNSSFFLANNALTQAITFPIVSSGPSAISALWGIILYKEIKGLKNFVILSFGFAFAVVGSILCGISK